METCLQCVILLINLFIIGVPSLLSAPNAATGVNIVRLRRQAGYVYDRPSLSFDLPSQTTVGSTSTQATTVDRISAQQMYYAYPAPAGGSTSNGYSNTVTTGATSSAASGATGYNYGAVAKNTVTGTTGTADVRIGYSGSGSASTVTSGGSTGYNYGSVTQNRATVNTGGGTSTLQSGGYNYQVQNTGLQTNINSGSTGYTASTLGSNSVVSTNSVSTKAPEYLPPPNTGGENVGGSVATNTQTVSGTISANPSDSYIPPSTSVTTQQKTPSVTVTPTGGYIAPSINVVPQTSTAPVSTPNSFYLAPNSGSQISNNQNTQTKVTETSSGTIQQTPNQEYLPPVITSSGPVSTPAAKYLPPVFK